MGRNEILSIVFCNLNRTSERLAETSTKLLVEKQQKQTLPDTINMRQPLICLMVEMLIIIVHYSIEMLL